MENNESECLKLEPVVEPKMEMEVKTSNMNQNIVPVKERRNGKDEKSKKKEDRSIDYILKGFNNLETPEEKLSALCKKYIEILDENRKLQIVLKQTEKKVLIIQREKEQCQSEKSKAVLTRSRLESLCRELQRQNKAVKEESLLKIREEEEKRKEVSAKFQSTLAEITALMAETNEKNFKLHEDNIEIHKKFKSVFDEMDIREHHFQEMHQILKHELQVAEARSAKVAIEMTEEKEILLKEKNQLLLKLTEYQTRIRDLQTIEANLRSQINMYTDKYEEFQNALTKSNEVFGGFNEEMEKLSKKNLKLEKEMTVWKVRWEKSHATLLEMATDKQVRDAEIVTLNRKCSRLQELCKAFQKERATLLSQLKEQTCKPKSEITEQSDMENNEKSIGKVENPIQDPTMNGSTLIEKVNIETEQQTKETNDATNIANNAMNSNGILENSNTSKENIQMNSETVNGEFDKRLIETVPIEIKETVSTIHNINKESNEKNDLDSNEKKYEVQVPDQISESIKPEITSNIEPSTDNTELKKEENIDPVISDVPNVIECINKLEKNEELKSHLEDSKISEIKDESIIGTDIDKIDLLVPNGEIDSNSVSIKKHKDGKKKKK